MGACRGRVLAVLIVLLRNLLQLRFALAVFGVLVLFPFTRPSILPHALQLPQHALGMCAPRLNVLDYCRLDLVTHGEQLAARWY